MAAARLLLLLLAAALGSSALLFVAWQRAAATPQVERLTSADRLALVEDLLETSPGIYQDPWFAPQIGYTLVPDREIEAWDDRFRANEIGFRAPALAKEPDTLRIAFVGDSWTYGMGVREGETYGHRAAELASRELGRPVQAWNLALPGYNSLNQVAALRYFLAALAPDVVVLAPTPNDVESAARVRAGGFLGRPILDDEFGWPHGLRFPHSFAESHLVSQRWERVAGELAQLQEDLAERDVPLLLFFTGTWRADVPDRLVAGRPGLRYLVTPTRMTTREWRNPPPIGHPTVAAHRAYGALVYEGLAQLLGWRRLPANDLEGLEDAELVLRAASPEARPFRDWGSRRGARGVADHFAPGTEDARLQAVGPLDPRSGQMGWSTTLWLRRRPRASRLRIELAPLADAPGEYPLVVRAQIPSPAGDAVAETSVGAGPASSFLEVAIPGGIAPGRILDLYLEAESAFAAPGSAHPRSVRIVRVEQL